MSRLSDTSSLRVTQLQGLTLITQRTDAKDIIGGEIYVGVGPAHAAAIHPDQTALPHFIEHCLAKGASTGYGRNQAYYALKNDHFLTPNTSTYIGHTRYFSKDPENGIVHVASRFYDALETTMHNLCYPLFDQQTVDHERKRIVQEIHLNNTAERLKYLDLKKRMYDQPYIGLVIGGAAEQVEKASPDDLKAFFTRSYTRDRMALALVGDVDHDEAIRRVEPILQNFHTAPSDLPVLSDPVFQKGEAHFHDSSLDRQELLVSLRFPAPHYGEPTYAATYLAFLGLKLFWPDAIKDAFGAYKAEMTYHGALTKTPEIALNLATSDARILKPSFAKAFQFIRDPDICKAISDRQFHLVTYLATREKVAQRRVEEGASFLLSLHDLNAPLKPREDLIERVRKVKKGEIKAALDALRKAPLFVVGKAGTSTRFQYIPAVNDLYDMRLAKKFSL